MADDLSDLYSAYGIALPGSAPPPPSPSGAPAVAAPASTPLQPGESAITVTPHGAQHPVDDLSDLNAAYAAPATPKMGVGQDIAASAGSGLVRGVVGAPVAGASVASGLASTIMNAGEYGVRKIIGAPKSYHDIKTDNQKAQDAYEAHAVIPGPVQLGAAAQDALTPYLHAPETTPGKVAEGVAEFAPFVAANPAGVAQLGVNAPKAVGALTGAANGAENLVAAAPSIAGAAGMIGSHVVAPAVGSQAAGAVADKLAPDFSDEARLAGGFAGGAAAHGIGKVSDAVGSAAAPVVAKGLATAGLPGMQEKLAARKALSYVSGNKADFVSQLDLNQPKTDPSTGMITNADGTQSPSPDRPLPNFPVSSYQLTGNEGLGQAERGFRTVNPAPFNEEINKPQQAAQVSAMAQPQEIGDPSLLVSHLNDYVDGIHADAQQRVDEHLARSVQAADDATANPGQEQNAEALRNVVVDANQAAKDRTGALYKTVDPDSAMVSDTAPFGASIAKTYGSLSKTEQALIQPREKEIINLVKDWGPQMPYRDLAAVSSKLAANMRSERYDPEGSSAAVARMTQIMGGLKQSINESVKGKQAEESAAVASGAMDPQATMASRLGAMFNEIANSGEQQQAATGFNGGMFAEGVQPRQGSLDLGGGNTTGNGRPGSASPGGTAGVSADDGGFADRLKAASASKADQAATFEKGFVGQVTAPGPTKGTFRMRDSSVPNTLFRRGPSGYEGVKEYHKAAGAGPDAVKAMQNTAMDVLRGKVTAEGLPQKALTAFKSQYAPALRAMDEVSPGFSSRFDDAAKAQDALLRARAEQKQTIKDYQAGALGKVIGARSPDEVVNRIGDAIKAKDGVAQLRQIASAAETNPEARAGLVAAVHQYVANQFTEMRKAGLADSPTLKAGRFKDFFTKNEPKLAEVLPPEDLESMRKVVRAYDIADQSNINVATKGPGSAGDIAASLKVHGPMTHGNSFLSAAIIAGSEAFEHFGLRGAAAASGLAGAGYIFKTLRSAGIHDINQLTYDALRNPDRLRQYIKRLSPNEYREKAHAGLVQQSFLGNGPRDRDDSGPGGAPPPVPPTSPGRFSPAGRGASASPLATDERGRIEPTPPDLPESRGNVVRVARPSDLNAAAAHVNTEPTEAQAAANNYRHGHAIVEGLPVSIENPRGSTRSGVGDDGKPWSVRMPADYGYFKASKGADGDHIDTYVGRRASDGTAHVIDQVHPDTGAFDESKVLLHAGTAEQAANLYKRGFSDGKGADRIGDITTLPIDQLKEWLSKPQTKPMSEKLRALIEARDGTGAAPPKQVEQFRGNGGAPAGSMPEPGLTYGNRTVSARMHGPESEAALGHDVPGTTVRPFGGPLDPQTGLPQGIVAYHGTPHDFDRFSSDHIGNGEGNQVYGHGLYFAQNEKIGHEYRDRLSDAASDFRVGGRSFKRSNLVGAERSAFDQIKDSSGDIDAAIREARQQVLKDANAHGVDWNQRLGILQNWKDDGYASGGNGHLYQVRINRDPEHFLDWDKKYSEQSPHVREALDAAGAAPQYEYTGLNGRNEAAAHQLARMNQLNDYKVGPDRGDGHNVSKRENPTGEKIYRSLADGGDPDEVARHLSGFGIAGIRYLDGGSRRNGDGTSNYVAFNDHDIIVTHKNGQQLEQPRALPDYLRGEAAASFKQEMKQSGVHPTDFSPATMEAAHQSLLHTTRLDHAGALEDAAIAQLPKDIRDEVFSGPTQEGGAPSPQPGQGAGNASRGEASAASAGERSSSAGETGQRSRGQQAPQYGSQSRQSAGAIGETVKAAIADAGRAAPVKATSLPFSPERSTKPIVSEVDGSTVQPVRTSSFSDMMHESDVSDDHGAEPLLRGNSMAIGDMLSRRIGDIPVHVVDEAGMRKMTSMRFHGDDSVPAGFYEGGNRNRIVVLDRYMEDKSAAAHLMLHEGLHAAFSHVIDSSAPTREIIDHLRDYATATHLEGGGEASDHYGLSNPHEFVSEAFSNPDFQRFLSGIQAPDYLVKALGIGKTGAQPTIWDAFTAAVRRILRIPNGQHSLLDAAMKVVPMLESVAPHDAATSRSSPSLGASP